MAVAKGIENWIEGYLHREIDERRRTAIYPLLWSLSQLFRFGIFWRHCFFDIGLLRKSRVEKPVVSVGNIAVGGSGKTPFVRMLAKDVDSKVAILHRGYRSSTKKKGLVSHPNDGDEAYMLSKSVKNSRVFVGKNRIQSASLGEKEGAEYHILDDGMQYRYLERDLEIVVIHRDDVLNAEGYLPSGLLRDSPKRLKKADYIVINQVKLESEFNELRVAISKYSSAPIIGTGYEVVEKDQFEGRVVGAYCGIARPKGFYQLLHLLGCRIVHNQTVGDHRRLPNSEEFVKESLAAGAEMVVCTEKDYVKLDKTDNVSPVKIEMKILFGQDHYLDMVKNINKLIKDKS